MEVQKHPHHPMHKKRWPEYLLEFFMLFLAVFLGFVAENIREHIVERSKEKEYISALLEDLQTDTAILHNVIPQMKQNIRGLDTLIDQTYLAIDGKADTRIMYYAYHHYCRNVFNFELSQRTINQLKNSGNMRLIHDKFAASIMSQMEIGFDQLKQQTAFYKMRQEDPSNFGMRIFNFREYQKANNNPDGSTKINDNGFLHLSYSPALNVTDPVYLKEFAAKVGYFRNSLLGYANTHEGAIPSVENSLNIIRKNYHLD